MNDIEYRDYCLTLAQRFSERLAQEAGRASPDDPLRDLQAGFEALACGQDVYERGPALVARLFGSCPQLAPLFPRELLWFIGGECLHFMPDSELAQFQQLEDMRADAAARGERLDYQAERAKLLKLQ
ncbi:MAG: PA2817 family protein [Halieaceae bacterium]|jgi:hypothetical protein|nr:PA2817 family protein [Halieaceae bacterium]